MKKRTKLVNEILFDEIILVTNVSTSKFLLMMNLFNPHMQKLGPRGPTHYIFGD